MRLVLSALVVLLAMAFVGMRTARAEETKTKAPAGDLVKGTITKVDGQTITVNDRQITVNDQTEIIKEGKAYTKALEVGQSITARVKDGVATRIEIHTKKAGEKHKEKHGNGDAK